MAVLSMAATRISGVHSRVGCTYSKARCENTLPCQDLLALRGFTQLQGVLFTSAGTRSSCHVPSMSGSLEIQGSMRSRGSIRFEPFRAVGGNKAKGCFRPRRSSASHKTCLCSLQAKKLAAETSRRLKPARTSRSLRKVVALAASLSSSKPSALLEGAPSSQRVSRGPRFLRSGFRGDPLLRVCGELMAVSGRRKGRGSALACSCSVDLASRMFTFGTAMVVPFYTLMLAAPKWRGTRKVMDSAIPYVILGAMYMYLLSISWTPEHPKLMFSSKYWLPELSGITRMFSSMLTVSSAWIHLLAVDLFAGRNIYLDSITHNLPCRHSLVLCLMFGPVGIFSHLFTKNIVMAWRKATKTEKDNRASEAGPINVFPNEPFAGSGHHEPTVDGVRPSKARGT